MDTNGDVLLIGVGYDKNTSLHLADVRAVHPGKHDSDQLEDIMLSELRDNLLGVVIASLPGFIFAFFGIHEIMTSHRKRKQETARAIGKVLSFVTRESRTGRYRNVVRVHDSPVVEFNANGTTVQHKSDTEYKENTFKVGEVVDLFYDPNDPAHFHLEREFDHLPHLGVILIVTGIGWVVFVCTSVVLFPM